ncbi:MAG TPA: DUF11 domain-containing protein [Chloroflexota bacterium]|nr:DUF11 domain-containing protein [Chloroflexota bacterium]
MAIPNPVAVGAELTFHFVVRNDGPGAATGVVVTDTLPANTTFVSATPERGTCAVAGQALTCTVGALAVGEIIHISIVVHATPEAAGTTLTNTATVRANEFDPHPEDNTSTATVFVLPPTATPEPGAPTATAVPSVIPSPLRVIKTGSPATATVGDAVTYSVTVTNPNTIPVDGVMVTDTLPPNTELVSATTTLGTCSGTVSLVCTIGTLAPGQTVTITISIRPTPAAAGTTLINTAVATAPGLPQVTATVTTLVSGAPMMLPNVAPLLPPSPPILLPPPPSPLIPAPPSTIAGEVAPPLPEVPIIPEADSLPLLGAGLALAAALAGLRAWWRRQH